MVDFRRWITALAVLALFAGLASAQVGGSGSGNGPLACSATVAVPPQLRSESITDLIGDIVITCTGGQAPAAGQPIPTANITVSLATNVTSRILTSSGGLSEALLLVDEPGAAGLSAPGGANTGPLAPQTLCAIAGGASPTGCGVQYVATANGLPVASSSSTGFAVPANMFLGVVSGNQVIFNGIPILAPVTSGYARVFRITNIRGNASQFAGQSGTFQGQTPIYASISISSAVVTGPANPLQTTAFLYDGLGTTVARNANNTNNSPSSVGLLQCNTAGLTAGSVLRFPEGFAAAFKTRVAPTSSYSGAGTTSSQTGVSATSIQQNVPGAIYNGSESGFVFAVGGSNFAGFADFGTRLKATFNNVPTGANLYVSTTNLPHGTNVPAATNTGNMVNLLTTTIPSNTASLGNMLAGLVISETAGASSLATFIPLQAGTNNSGGVNLFGPLPVDANGTATAVWEVLAANPNAFETAEFAVFYSYTGNPSTNTPPTSPVGTVSMSFAPTFASATASSLIPRFIPPATSNSIISFVLCQTTLLYPFVTSSNGIDTGIAIANTTTDPFGTRNQAGTCDLYFYGTGQGTTNKTTTTSVASGTVYAELASNLKPNFNGYVIATCNFQLAHGYALVSDTGLRNWATNYLALVLPTGVSARNGQAINYNGVSGGNGASAIEGTVH